MLRVQKLLESLFSTPFISVSARHLYPTFSISAYLALVICLTDFPYCTQGAFPGERLAAVCRQGVDRHQTAVAVG